MSTLALSFQPTAIPSPEGSTWFAGAVGFFFVFRVGLTFLFFQANPVAATALIALCDMALVYGAIVYSSGQRTDTQLEFFRNPTLRWIAVYLVFSLSSIWWTGAQSRFGAFGYWATMTADVVVVLLLMRGEAKRSLDGVLKGIVWGAAALALVAWNSPVTADLRLGNDEFLHPNTLGLQFGVATLIAQYLSARALRWKILSILLAITLLRTLSKTAIVAFIVAECWYLVRDKKMTRRAKAGVIAVALLVLACFWNLLRAYLYVYDNAGSGNQTETLTGRTVLWSMTLSMGLEKPWVGHGIYSFKALIPALGDFAAVHAHNDLLQQFFEYGGCGVAIALAIHWSFVRSALRSPDSELRTLALGLFVFAVLHGITDTVPFGFSYPLWLLAPLSFCLVAHQDGEVRP